ncbi:hypothetical protein [Streptomyces sp. NPDC046759]|uniref:hypothetical protein n=1 Tax=Streptomyces sp. NPDC046759 TaxID=3155019 RepID=UPI0033EC9F30
MRSIRSTMACAAAGILLTAGGIALAAPAQAQVRTAAAPQSAAAVPAATGTGTGTGDTDTHCGLLGLGCVLQGLLGGVKG